MEPLRGTENQSCCGGCSGLCSGNSNSVNNTTTNSTSPGNPGVYFLEKHLNQAEYPESLVRLLGSENMDSYTAGIELSNACREFYVQRQKAAETFKSKLSSEEGGVCDSLTSDQKEAGGRQSGVQRGSLESKMRLLKQQLSSLIDQDLLLMKQFLTLNERIEELKWQRKMESYQLDHTTDSTLSTASSSLRRSLLKTHKVSSSATSSRAMSTEFLDLKYPTPSELSLFNECSTETLGPSNGEMSLKKGKTAVDTDYVSDQKDNRQYEDSTVPSYTTRTSTLDKFMFKTTASLRHSDCRNHKDVVGHCIHCPRNLINLGQIKDSRSNGVMLRADSGHFTEESKCSTLSSTYTDSGERLPENTSFDSGISDQENQSDFVVEV